MSDDEQMATDPARASPSDVPSRSNKQKYKSWRKKYRKMKAHFDDVLKENNASFVEEQKLEALNRRLQEQNDQLLEILLDLNDSLKIPKSLRYNIAFPSIAPTAAIDMASANADIASFRDAVQAGDYPQAAYTSHLRLVESALSRQSARKLSDLEARTPHPLPPSAALVAEVDTTLHPEFLTTTKMDDYLQQMDTKASDPHSLAQPLPSATPKFGDMTPRELEREIEMRNFHSVHNWLKRYNKENSNKEGADDASEAGTTVATPATNRKRNNNLAKKVGDRAVDRARGGGDKGDKGREEGSPASVRSAGAEEDGPEDGSILVGAPASGKKKGEKDDTYRPKGGRSSKAKRKREGDDGGATPTAKGKKARTSMATSTAGDI